jgi:hypothetical protein
MKSSFLKRDELNWWLIVLRLLLVFLTLILRRFRFAIIYSIISNKMNEINSSQLKPKTTSSTPQNTLPLLSSSALVVSLSPRSSQLTSSCFQLSIERKDFFLLFQSNSVLILEQPIALVQSFLHPSNYIIIK